MIGTFATVAVITGIGVTSPLTGVALLLFLLLAGLVAAAASGGAAVLLERIAYRPLRQARSHPAGRPDQRHRRLAVPPAAVLAAVVPRPITTDRILDKDDRRDDRLRRPPRRQAPRVRRGRPDDGAARPRRERHPASVARSAPPPRAPNNATLMGVDIDRVIMSPSCIGGAMAGIGGMLYVIFFEVDDVLRRASSSASRPSPRPCSAASATSAVPCSAACSSD